MFRPPRRGMLDVVATLLCLWAAAYHTPPGALARGLLARLTGSSTSARPLLTYYSAGVYDGRDHRGTGPTPVIVPDGLRLAAVPPGQALGRGVYAVSHRLGGEDRRVAEAFAARHGGSLADSDAVGGAVAKAAASLGSDEAATLGLFVGAEVVEYAVRRTRAEGRALTLSDLARQLPPASEEGVARASLALTLGTAYGLSWPVPLATRVSSPFGYRTHPTLGRGHLHTGVDLVVPVETPVTAVADGVVTRASEDAVNGRVVIVSHGRGVTTAYCHNHRLLVAVGQRVTAGQRIADSGNSGRSTGPHLHYQLELGHRPVDPFLFRGVDPVLVVPLPAAGPPRHGRPAGVDPALRQAFDRFGSPPASEE